MGAGVGASTAVEAPAREITATIAMREMKRTFELMSAIAFLREKSRVRVLGIGNELGIFFVVEVRWRGPRGFIELRLGRDLLAGSCPERLTALRMRTGEWASAAGQTWLQLIRELIIFFLIK